MASKYLQTYNHMMTYFNNDEGKVLDWFNTYNDQLTMSPINLLRLGQVDKVYDFVTTSIDENTL